ncbi:hypothetical protein [Helicobacter suis]|uniref:hypothetical protein n=1 Tax=Helicobacter suis TaxID=104628 RepID=UPI0013D70E67|nr:hypothetical protein [Helicobacter suis]
MAREIVCVKNYVGLVKKCKIGFSWTTLFFGPFVPLIRKDWKWSCIFWGVCVVLNGLDFLFALHSGTDNAMNIISSIVDGVLGLMFCVTMVFLYNKIYIEGLLDKGYMPLEEADRQILNRHGFSLSPISSTLE